MSTALVRFFNRGVLVSAVSFKQKGFAVPALLQHYLSGRSGTPFLTVAAPLGPTAIHPPAADAREFDIRLDVAEETPDAPLITLCEWTNETPVYVGGLAGFTRHVERGFGQC
jgi:hypothetical protein